ncbi:MAG TPA: hypothetical protein VEB41_00430 [Burkholderiales bacterium]|nr:hypothetical protein [Burkholderiales bacterium]
MRIAALLLIAFPPLAGAQAHEQEIQRALVQRDQQAAEFAAAARGQPLGPLQELHARQLREAMQPYPAELRPYQRQRMADERALVLSPPMVKSENEKAREPLALPGRPRHGVDPVLPQGLPY